jgi:hypothetical protein
VHKPAQPKLNLGWECAGAGCQLETAGCGVTGYVSIRPNTVLLGNVYVRFQAKPNEIALFGVDPGYEGRSFFSWLRILSNNEILPGGRGIVPCVL